MADTLKILFVCTGNTCRSVMAQGLFEKMWNDLSDNKMAVKAYSAGVAAIDGLSASQEALDILRSEGVDLSGHCSQRVTNELIEKADYIFTMTQGHKETLLNLYPEAKKRSGIFRVCRSKWQRDCRPLRLGAGNLPPGGRPDQRSFAENNCFVEKRAAIS